MTIIKWTDRLSVDNGIIDQDHKVLIDVTNQFLAMKNTAGKAELAAVLSDLEHYARSHFWRESELQRKIGFCYADRQAEEHVGLVATLANVVLRYHKAREKEELSAVANEIGTLLNSWLIDHILQSDIDMAAYRKEIAAVAAGMKPMKGAVGGAGLRTIGTEQSQGLSIDGGVIDEDHQHLIDIINDFIVATAEDVETAHLERILALLSSYTETHFSREEDLQKAVGFPYADAHHLAHQELLASLAGFETRLDSRIDAAKVRPELCAMLKTWLLKHIGEEDARMRPYVEEMRGPARRLKPFPRAMLWR